MQEFWFCSGCSSMNRADSGRCHKCQSPRQGGTLATVRGQKPGSAPMLDLNEENRQLAGSIMSGGGYTAAWQLGYLTAGLTIVAAVAQATYVALAVFRTAPQMPLPDSTDQAADQAADLADRPVIQPSTPGLRRYRAPFEDGAISQPIESERCEGQTASLDLDEGI